MDSQSRRAVTCIALVVLCSTLVSCIGEADALEAESAEGPTIEQIPEEPSGSATQPAGTVLCEPFEVFRVPPDAAELSLESRRGTGNDGLFILQTGLETPVHRISVPSEITEFSASGVTDRGGGWALGYYNNRETRERVPFFVDLDAGEIYRLPALQFDGQANKAGTMLVGVPATTTDIENYPETVAYSLPCGDPIATYDVSGEIARYSSAAFPGDDPSEIVFRQLEMSRVAIVYRYPTGGNGFFTRDVVYSSVTDLPERRTRRVFYDHMPVDHRATIEQERWGQANLLAADQGIIEFQTRYKISKDVEQILVDSGLPFRSAALNRTLGPGSPWYGHVVTYLDGRLWHINSPKNEVSLIGACTGSYRMSSSYWAGFPSLSYLFVESDSVYVQAYDLETEEPLERMNLTERFGYTLEDTVLIADTEYPLVGVYVEKGSGEREYQLLNYQKPSEVVRAIVQFTDESGK